MGGDEEPRQGADLQKQIELFVEMSTPFFKVKSRVSEERWGAIVLLHVDFAPGTALGHGTTKQQLLPQYLDTGCRSGGGFCSASLLHRRRKEEYPVDTTAMIIMRSAARLTGLTPLSSSLSARPFGL